MNETVHDPGQPRVGLSNPEHSSMPPLVQPYDPNGAGLPIENVSGSIPTVNDYVRPAQSRDAFGRFKVRHSRLVGPLGPAGGVGPGGVDVTTGRWIPGVRNSAQLHDLDRVHSVTTSPYFEVKDHSGHPPVSAMLDDGTYPRHLRREV